MPSPYFLSLIVLLAASMPQTFAADEQAALAATTQPFVEKYCLRCHDANEQEGEFRLDTLSDDFTDMLVAERWAEVVFRINAGEMPPPEEIQPDREEIGELVEALSTRIQQGSAARMARRGPVTHYRLSRDEYANTVYSLLGVHFDARMPGALNEDPRWHGFDRIGAMLSLSPSHVNRYYKAAETVVDQAFPVRQPESAKHRQAADAPHRWLIYPGLLHGNIQVQTPGLYRIRVQLSAVPSFKGRLARLSIWNNSLKRSEVGRDVRAPEDEPTIVEIEAFLPQGRFQLTNEAPGKLDDGPTPVATPNTVTLLKDYRPNPTGYKLFTDDGESIFPLLIVDWLEYEGPILPEADQQKRQGLYPSDEKNIAEAYACLKRFMARAWRRPVSDAEVARYGKIVESELGAGEDFRTAYLAAMTGVLTSKNFYYLVEGTPAEQRERVDAWELASRLSFFLWSSMPDEELFAAADSRELNQPDGLRAQLTRMLADPQMDRFNDSFPQQWLQLHRVGQFPADAELYPDYDGWLEQSMILETTGFFTEVFAENLSIREFLVSDWTVMNSRLAMHYQTTPLTQPGFQRVSLQPEDHRGGLLTQASILSLTSDGSRHRPVHRGVWVSEAIFAKTPPPPPPNVEPLEPTPSDQPKATIRQQLEAHATHTTCAACHQRIDPLGFAFDNYDAIGRWRTSEYVSGGDGEDPPIHASGVLPSGQAYNGPDEFKHLLVQDIDRFAEAFVEQLATFALRRVMTIDDAAQLHAIVEASKQDDYRLRTVIERLVMSDLFQQR